MRSVGAVLTAFAIASILAIGADYLMFRLFPASFDNQGISHDARVLVLVLCYSIGFVCLGGYIAAALATHSKRKHAIGFGIVILAATAVATSQNSDSAPAWYNISNLAMVLPAAAFGGRLRSP
jgi:hypothetical protein